MAGDGFCVQANLMVDDSVWPAMHAAYEAAEGALAERLVAALAAGQAAGGDIRGQQSAAMVVVSGERSDKPWQGRLLELRVEEHPRPVEELQRLLERHRAYRFASESDEWMAVDAWERAEQAMAEAVRRAPDIVELRFWAAHSLLMAGREAEALPRFREVFAAEPIWRRAAAAARGVGHAAG